MTLRRAPSPPMTRSQREAVTRAQVIANQSDPAHWNDAPITPDEAREALRTGVTQRLDFRGKLVSARRRDVWDEFLGRDALSPHEHAAVRRLEGDMALRAGMRDADRPELGARVDVASNREGFTQAMLDAGDRVESVLGLVGPPSCRILRALCEPRAEGPLPWRDVVQAATSEANAPAQAALLRVAAITLKECYEMIDKAKGGR